MLGFSRASEAELIAVEADAKVHGANGVLSKAVAELERLEAREKRYISIMNGTAEQVGGDEFQEAQDEIAVRKGTQTGFFLPAAEEARRGIVSLRQAYDVAVKQAKERLVEAGMVKLKALCGDLGPVLQEAMAIAAQIEELRNQVGQGGGDIDVHPFPVLLPGSLLAGQLESARGKGLL